MGGGKYCVGAELDSRVRADNEQIRAFEALLYLPVTLKCDVK